MPKYVYRQILITHLRTAIRICSLFSCQRWEAAAGLRPANTPPSMGSVVPVIQLAFSLAKNRIASTTSSGWPWRPIGWKALTESSTARVYSQLR